ncbi:sulfatase family protein [Catalinimonas niigatensis]|uniref:sulfatase family protein n=1 Tax=Catalinimonas niigatensis TaxID=1397264 RepID=UPI00266698F0|nr:arylsulfatase [Catalinimonas niigatensis]WPP49154.1 arylsulfatase [Catalinimonas niigatensis]
MNTNNTVFLFILALSLGWMRTPVEAQRKATEKPNVIIIFADDMGYGDVSCLNPEARTYTPHIDNLVRKGITFSNAHASASVCTPSRYGLLTGRYAWRSESGAHVVSGFGEPVIEQDRETIASLFQKEGYTTACIGKWHLGLDWQTKKSDEPAIYDANTGLSNVDYTQKVTSGPNDYGFDYSFIHPASLDMPPYMFLRNHQAIDPDVILTSALYPDRLDDTEYTWDKKHTGEHDVYWGKGVWWRRGEISRTFRVENCLTEILEESISFIEKHSSDKPSVPFFMYMPLTGPHTPWMPTEQFKGKSSIATYGDFIMNIDHVVGQVTETLRRLGMDENTMIIFSSDNGAYWPQTEIELHNHDANWGRRGQKGDAWDGGHRIPLIISWPSHIKTPFVYDHMVSLTDLFATFADLTDQKLKDNSAEDSFSFLRVLNGNTSKATRRSMVHQSSGGMYSIRMDGWKFIDGLGSGGFTAPSTTEPVSNGPTGQLYQIKSDSLESENLFLQHPDVVKRLQKELNQELEQGNR